MIACIQYSITSYSFSIIWLFHLWPCLLVSITEIPRCHFDEPPLENVGLNLEISSGILLISLISVKSDNTSHWVINQVHVFVESVRIYRKIS
jgi:hypothetical protein